MSFPSSGRGRRAIPWLRIVTIIWLLALSAATAFTYLSLAELADQAQGAAERRQVQALEARVAELADAAKAARRQPEPASQTELASIRQTLEARLAHLEQGLAGRATAAELQAVQAEIEQIKARQAKSRQAAATPAKPRTSAATLLEAVEPPLRVVGVELRGGERFLSIAPLGGALSLSQVQVLRPGEASGEWRLVAIEGRTAVFRAGAQVHRLSIP